MRFGELNGFVVARCLWVVLMYGYAGFAERWAPSLAWFWTTWLCGGTGLSRTGSSSVFGGSCCGVRLWRVIWCIPFFSGGCVGPSLSFPAARSSAGTARVTRESIRRWQVSWGLAADICERKLDSSRTRETSLASLWLLKPLPELLERVRIMFRLRREEDFLVPSRRAQ